MRILTISILNADHVEIGHFAEVSKNLSAYIFGFSVWGHKVLQLQKQEMKRSGGN
jgi:hypothetical protein